MSLTQPDKYCLAARSSGGSRFSKGKSRNKYQHVDSTDPLEGLSGDKKRFCEKRQRSSAVKADSLGSRVGLVCSNATMASPLKEAEAIARNFATYLKAFALIYVLPEVEWTAEKIDMLLEQGMELYRCSSDTSQPKVEDDQEGNQLIEPGIYSNEEKRIKRKFNLEGHIFTMAVEPRYLGEATRPHIIKNLKSVLQAFFKSSRYCILHTRVGHLLIWRRRKVFFVLDVKGRRRDDLRCDKDNGVAMLVCLKTIGNVVHLASNLSGITPQDAFSIRALVVLRLKTPDGRIYMRGASNQSVEFKLVNKSYAYLRSTLHLSLSENGTVKNRSSLMVAVGSILASKIDHPANWDTNKLDRLICYGVELCCSGWSDCLREQRPIHMDTFPTQLRLGQFVVKLKLVPGVRVGHWECGLDIGSSDFEANVREAIEGFGNVVFQINNQAYAMWFKDDFYYLLDPYRHTIVGTHVAEDQGAMWATLRMFHDRRTMLSVLHQLLQESNEKSDYSLHGVRIRNIAECPLVSPLPEDVDTCDVKSLNEPILFSDQLGATVQDHCLAEISDCEDEKETDPKESHILEERQCAGSAEDKVLKAPSPFQKRSKSKTRTLKNKKKVPRKPTTGDQCLGKKPTVTSKEMKRSVVSFQESGNTLKRSSPRKPVELTRKTTTKYETDLKRQKAGARVLANSTGISKAGLGSGKDPRDKWSANESIIRLGTKVAAESLINILGPNEGPSTSQKAVEDILKESLGNSNGLGVPQGANTPFFTSAPSGIDRQAEQALFHEQSERSESSLPRFPGYHREPQLLAVAGSESGTVESLNRLLGSAFKVANRVLTITPWGNYVAFRHSPGSGQGSASTRFFLFDGCTCNIDRFRHLDLSIGTAGLVAFRKLSEVVCHIIDSRKEKALNIINSQENKIDCGKH